MAIKFTSFLGTLHWPTGGDDLSHFGISFLELLILSEQWADLRFLSAKVTGPHVRANRPILIPSVPVSEGIEIRHGCQFISSQVCYGFAAGVWEVELLAAGVLAGCIGLAMVMRLMCSVLSTLLTLLLFSFVGVLNLLRMYSKVFGVRVLLSLGGMLFWVIGRLYVVVVRVVLFLPFIPGISGFSWIYSGFYEWVFDSLGFFE